ncbi:MAG TPA: PBP1A family penicillin-binding protein [Acidobacteriota bacterium]|nr:PBP1A family penicillin-binding protein [Acidobacteriota bacterium]HQG91518.1 PBP1A family penicillin-binding protein [Acidobacteriota bacterium]HQK86490.1 PBP1A family penicillin-binding protein [Acidobacteriota bacterium]
MTDESNNQPFDRDPAAADAQPAETQPEITPATRRRSRRFVFWVAYTLLLILFISLGILGGFYLSYVVDLPEVEALEDYQPSVVTEIFADDNTAIGQLYLERRKLVSPNDIPLQFKQAVIAIEDKSFNSHFGIDIQRIIQSAILDLFHMKIVRGASTITQQLSKLLFLSPEVSLERKIKEAILAIQIEKNYSKDRIFAFYANKIYFAHGNYGIASASEFYFDKSVKELTLSECALLAAIIKNPRRYSPLLSPENAKNRRNLVLQEMCDEGFITTAQLEAARKEPLRIVGKEMDKNFAGYFVEMVRQYLQRNYSNKQIFTEGLKVHTTLNREMQASSERAMSEGLRAYDRRKGWRDKLRNLLDEDPSLRLDRYRLPDWRDEPVAGGVRTGLVFDVGPDRAVVRIADYIGELGRDGIKWTRRKAVDQVLRRGDLAEFRVVKVHPGQRKLELSLEQVPAVQGAFLALENRTGAIKALVGGFDWTLSKFNRAVQAKRQTGSTFKPFVYTTALLAGATPDDVVLDEPLTFVDDLGVEYAPRNYTNEFKGNITLRQALAESINIPAVRIGLAIGIPNVIRTARKFGITSQLRPYPSIALGAFEITLLEQVSAFSTFPNDGYRMEPYFIQRIEDYHGNVLEEHKKNVHEVIPGDTARDMISMLRGSVEFGTSQKAKSLNAPCAGKTGTTNDFTDSWFIGFTPSVTAGAWVGFDEKKSLGDDETGARVALPIWIDFMKDYLKNHPPERFPAGTEPYLSKAPTSGEPVIGPRRKVIEEDLD